MSWGAHIFLRAVLANAVSVVLLLLIVPRSMAFEMNVLTAPIGLLGVLALERYYFKSRWLTL